MRAWGRSVWVITLSFFGLVTSMAVTFLGADSWAVHSTRRPSRVRCRASPSPQLPKPSRGCWASRRMFLIIPPDAVFAFETFAFELLAFMVPPLLVEILAIRRVILTNSRAD